MKHCASLLNFPEKFRNFSTDLGLHHLDFASLLQILFSIFQVKSIHSLPSDISRKIPWGTVFIFVRLGASSPKEPRIPKLRTSWCIVLEWYEFSFHSGMRGKEAHQEKCESAWQLSPVANLPSGKLEETLFPSMVCPWLCAGLSEPDLENQILLLPGHGDLVRLLGHCKLQVLLVNGVHNSACS